ncbi:hypothetical protein EDD17DRAFT_1503918 [Pisolithus thermaeus]|nr:hypothetical protein EDD17DRAFT_1503918 [Pisolithus thermaeus]
MAGDAKASIFPFDGEMGTCSPRNILAKTISTDRSSTPMGVGGGAEEAGDVDVDEYDGRPLGCLKGENTSRGLGQSAWERDGDECEGVMGLADGGGVDFSVDSSIIKVDMNKQWPDESGAVGNRAFSNSSPLNIVMWLENSQEKIPKPWEPLCTIHVNCTVHLILSIIVKPAYTSLPFPLPFATVHQSWSWSWLLSIQSNDGHYLVLFVQSFPLPYYSLLGGIIPMSIQKDHTSLELHKLYIKLSLGILLCLLYPYLRPKAYPTD